jgi:1-deoxy-D-xylulose-5-phosphate synthase
VLAEPAPDQDVDVLVVAIGATAGDALAAGDAVRQAGFSLRVVDPGWVAPVPRELVDLAARAQLVVTVEDGSAIGGVGTRVAQTLGEAGCLVPVRQLGMPREFPAHGAVADVKSWASLTIQDIGRRIVEWSVVVSSRSDSETDQREHEHERE